MKYDTAPEFDVDFKRLKEQEQRLFHRGGSQDDRRLQA